MFMMPFLFQTKSISLSLSELEKLYENAEIVTHFKSVYPSYSVQTDLIKENTTPHFMYIADNKDKLAELRTAIDLNDKDPKFTYLCSYVYTEQVFLRIDNPSNEDIDNNRCW